MDLGFSRHLPVPKTAVVPFQTLGFTTVVEMISPNHIMSSETSYLEKVAFFRDRKGVYVVHVPLPDVQSINSAEMSKYSVLVKSCFEDKRNLPTVSRTYV